MISEGSCDTEAWSIDAEHSALITGINYTLKCIQIEIQYFVLINTINISSNKCSLSICIQLTY